MTITINNFKSNFDIIEAEEFNQITEEFNYSLTQLKESFSKQVNKTHIRCEQCDRICDEHYCYRCEHYSTREKLIKTYQYRGFKVRVHELNQVKNVVTGLPKNPLQYRVFDRSGDLVDVWRTHEIDYSKDYPYTPFIEFSRSKTKKLIKLYINNYLKPEPIETEEQTETKRQRRVAKKIKALVIYYYDNWYGVEIDKGENIVKVGCRKIEANCNLKRFKEVFSGYIKDEMFKKAFIQFKKALL